MTLTKDARRLFHLPYFQRVPDDDVTYRDQFLLQVPLPTITERGALSLPPLSIKAVEQSNPNHVIFYAGHERFDNQLVKVGFIYVVFSGDPTNIDWHQHGSEKELWAIIFKLETSLEGHGIGKALIRYLETTRPRGIQGISVRPSDESRSFYQHLGFHPHPNPKYIEFIKELP